MPKRGRGPQLPKQMKEMISDSGASGSLKSYGGRKGGNRNAAPASSKKTKLAVRPQPIKPEPKKQPPKQEKQSNKRKHEAEPQVEEPEAKKFKKKTALEKLMEAQQSSAPKGKGSAKRQAMSAAEAQEDLEIAWLEAQLARGGGKGGDDEGDDGLDDLLGELDHVEAALGWREDVSAPRNHSESEEDDNSDSQHSDEDAELDLDDDAENLEDWDGILDEDEEEEEDDSEEEEEEDDDSISEEDEGSVTPQEGPSTTTSPKPAAPAATSSTAYVPPHLRQKTEEKPPAATSSRAGPAEPPADPRLDRLVSSHLNKLSPANLSQIHSALSSLYTDSDFSRAAVAASLVRLLLVRLDTKDSLGETQILTFAALVGGLKNVREGVLAESLKRFDAKDRSVEVDEEQGKSAANLVRFWARLYNLGVISCAFVYGLIRELVKRLQEPDVEQLLLLLKVSGQQLRSDDPTSLKEIAQLVSDRAASETLSSRGKFMIETLTNLKHNRPNKNATDSGLATTEEQFKKHLKKAGLDTLNMSLDELRQAESRGKWWVVGNAWAGDPLVERQQQEQKSLAGNASQGSAQQEEQKWMKLARKQGMNTTVRQGIFVALMGAEDYVDAVDRLAGLGLTEVQQREIVRVILHCSGHEKAYNPYYTLVLQRLLSTNHSHAITTQYALWDLFREMGESTVGGHERLKTVSESEGGKELGRRRARNLERLFGWVLAQGGLSLGVFKPLPFYTLKPASKAFLVGVLKQLFLSSQSNSGLQLASSVRNPAALEEVFVKIVGTGTADGLGHVISELVEETEDDFQKRMGENALEVLEMGSSVAHDVDRLR